MFSIEKCTVIPNSLLASYAENGYADSYCTDLPGHISMEDYVFSFYTTALFKLERFILTWTVLKPSNDLQAKELMDGKTDKFAAWTIEARKDNELLMCDMLKRTRSWFMVKHTDINNTPRTKLYFGTGIAPATRGATVKTSIGLFFILLLPFHKLYSVFLLLFAKRRLSRT